MNGSSLPDRAYISVAYSGCSFDSVFSIFWLRVFIQNNVKCFRNGFFYGVYVSDVHILEMETFFTDAGSDHVLEFWAPSHS